MKHVSASLIVAFSAHAAQACPFDLRGTWKSDRETSMAFVRENAKLQPKTEAFLAALYGHMTLTFTRREVHLVMPDIEDRYRERVGRSLALTIAHRIGCSFAAAR